MLHTMRRVGGSIFAKILIVMLVISFGVWGVGDILRDHSSSQIATVGNDYIPASEFINQRSLMRQAMASLNIKNIDDKAIDGQIIVRLVQQRLVRLWLAEAGLAINRDALADAIKTNRQFKGITGRFDKDAFEQFLKQQRLTETAYLAQLRNELAGKALQSTLDMSDARMPDAFAFLETAVATQKRDALIVSVPMSAVSNAAISEQALQEHYNMYKTQRYMEPERRTLEYVSIDTYDIQSMINQSITDALLRERYEANPSAGASFEAARPALLKQIQSEKRDTILQDFSITIDDALAGGNSMGQALAKAGVKSQSKLLTRITATQLSGGADALLKAVSTQGFSINDGESSGLQSTDDGRYFMVMAKEVIPAAPKPFDAVKNDVREHVAKELASNAVYHKATLARTALMLSDATARNAALAKLGLSTSTATVTRPTIDANGQLHSPYGSLPAMLLKGIFDQRIGEVSGPIAAADGSALVALVTGVHQPSLSGDAGTSPRLQMNYENSLSDSVISTTFSALAMQHKVSVNEALLQQLTQASAP